MITLSRAKQVLGNRRKIGVIGDLMVDEYLWGKVSRISPEAPVPIVEISDEHLRLGGSANVAKNLLDLGHEVRVFGVTGKDRMGSILAELLQENKIDISGVVQDQDRPTTVKTRIIGGNQHLARVDKESVSPIQQLIEEKLVQKLEASLDNLDALIIEDYNKGVMTEGLIRETIRMCREKGIRVTVDPKWNHFFSYRDVTLFKPNRKETEVALQLSLDSEESVMKAGKKLIEILHPELVLITLGSRGMALFNRHAESFFLPTEARDVADVSGAGDTVISTLTAALAGGGTPEESVMLANIAAGISCSRVGVVSVSSEEIYSQIEKRSK